MAVTLTNACAAAMLGSPGQGLLDRLGAGAKIKCYSGSVPASAEDALGAQVLVAEFVLPDPSGVVSNKTLTLDADPDLEDQALSATQMTFWRGTTSADVAQCQGSITETGGGGDVTVDNDTPTVGQTVRLTSLTISLP